MSRQRALTPASSMRFGTESTNVGDTFNIRIGKVEGPHVLLHCLTGLDGHRGSIGTLTIRRFACAAARGSATEGDRAERDCHAASAGGRNAYNSCLTHFLCDRLCDPPCGSPAITRRNRLRGQLQDQVTPALVDCRHECRECRDRDHLANPRRDREEPAVGW